jgi:glyoxylase-like metal-dependent hydrolase (beta-lactamase superfamily II)
VPHPTVRCPQTPLIARADRNGEAMWQLHVSVVKVGTCTIDPGNVASNVTIGLMHQLGIGGGSTVAIVKSEKDCLLVDTGYDRESDLSGGNDERNRTALTAALQLHGVTLGEINKVFVTHFHRDHAGGLGHFGHAEWYCHRDALDACDPHLRSRFHTVAAGDRILDDTVVLETPGHTRGHSSLLWTSERNAVRVCIAGDAILNLAWLQSGMLYRFNTDFAGTEAARVSQRTILDLADLIIPGHGQPFYTTDRLKGIARGDVTVAS